MKINKRLSSLSQMVNEEYALVWDCCCDHGLLGMNLLVSGKVKQVNFIDIVPSIIDKLANKLSTYRSQFPIETKWETRCCDVASLDLNIVDNLFESETLDIRQLVIISGVGGDLMVEMVNKLVINNYNLNIDYLLSPVLHTYKLRHALKELNFKVKKEQLVIDNHRGYEMLLVNQQHGNAITLTGDSLWCKKVEHERYLLKLIEHYSRTINIKNKDLSVNESALELYKSTYSRYYG